MLLSFSSWKYCTVKSEDVDVSFEIFCKRESVVLSLVVEEVRSYPVVEEEDVVRVDVVVDVVVSLVAVDAELVIVALVDEEEVMEEEEVVEEEVVAEEVDVVDVVELDWTTIGRYVVNEWLYSSPIGESSSRICKLSSAKEVIFIPFKTDKISTLHHTLFALIYYLSEFQYSE